MNDVQLTLVDQETRALSRVLPPQTLPPRMTMVTEGRASALRCVLVADQVSKPLTMLERLARHAGIRLMAVLPDHPLATVEAASLLPDIVFLTPGVDVRRWTDALAAAARGASREPPTIAVVTDDDPPAGTGGGERGERGSRGAAPGAPQQLIVRDRGSLVVLRDAEIEWLRAEDRHVAVCSGAAVRLVRRTLNAFERALDPNRFVRIHRDFIVRLDRVREIHPMFHGDQELVLHDGTHLPLSRRYLRRFLDLTQLAEAAR